ncbi:4-hydroxybenzoate polyprenyltransferase [Sinobacterium caligoides]|uniref:4-hydroxybenzoate octaprenyltransferase n=1 Tax=Sinobacterium caligoides TaxID=933926 RepID=A0A3N2DI68_9GAMM|nr:4-hydroxybenzoate octaprenyltransferase [Sinobacterium caligoides]ROR99084.1 4-hydroxybenzoate polyprenyltransferase [Sinobacterium caligoides]
MTATRLKQRLLEFKQHRLADFIALTRINRPIGIYLLLWPAMWSLWLAGEGHPSIANVIIFLLGGILMRSAGCIINDYADRDFDGHVERTKLRPLARGAISTREAMTLFAILCLLSFLLVLFTNKMTVLLSFGGMALAATYPFMKRITNLPQVILGAAYSWPIPMAFSAETETLPQAMWLIFVAAMLWIVVYDTFYAMVDREDDLKIGVKSTAILFGDADRLITGSLQVTFLLAMALAGRQFDLSIYYYLGLAVAAGLSAYQQYLIKDREREKCFKAFLHNHWVGMAIFIGILLHYLLM